jgi:hypothetical protein
LIFQVRVDVFAHTAIKAPMLVVSRSWWDDSLTTNAIAPQPASQTSQNGHPAFSLGPLRAGHRVAMRVTAATVMTVAAVKYRSAAVMPSQSLEASRLANARRLVELCGEHDPTSWAISTSTDRIGHGVRRRWRGGS